MRRGLEASRGSFWYTRKAVVSMTRAFINGCQCGSEIQRVSVEHKASSGISSEPLRVNRLWSLEEKRFPPLQQMLLCYQCWQQLIRHALGAGLRKAHVFCLLGNRRILMRTRVAGYPLIKWEGENRKVEKTKVSMP